MIIKINNVDISDYIAYNGLKRGRSDVDDPDAGRTLDGVMHRGRVGTKIRWDVTCRPLTTAELHTLEDLIMPEYVTVTVSDPYYGTVTKTMYSNNTSASFLLKRRDGTEWWSGVEFPLIEV